MIHIASFAVAFMACCIYALLAGGWPERAAMLAQLGALILTLLTGFLHVSGMFHSFIWGWAIADVGLAAVLTILALQANRYWTIILAGLQVAAVFVHVGKVLFPALPATGYAMFLQLWAWPMLIVTAVGTFNHRQRSARLGSERDWKTSWRPSTLLTPQRSSIDWFKFAAHRPWFSARSHRN